MVFREEAIREAEPAPNSGEFRPEIPRPTSNLAVPGQRASPKQPDIPRAILQRGDSSQIINRVSASERDAIFLDVYSDLRIGRFAFAPGECPINRITIGIE